MLFHHLFHVKFTRWIYCLQYIDRDKWARKYERYDFTAYTFSNFLFAMNKGKYVVFDYG